MDKITKKGVRVKNGGGTVFSFFLFLSIFIFSAFILNSCARKEDKKPITSDESIKEDKKPITSDESINYSLEGVDTAFKVSSAVAKSVVSMRSQDKLQQSMITGRMITARAPQLKLSTSPKFSKNSPSKKANRIKSKTDTENICSVTEDGISIYFQDEQENWVHLFFSYRDNNLSLSFSSSEGGFWVNFVNCSAITLSCNGINTPEDAWQYLDHLISQALGNCTFESVSSWYPSGFVCSLGDFDHDQKFSVSYSYSPYSDQFSQPITSVFIDESGFVWVQYCDSQGTCNFRNYSCPVEQQIFQNLSCGSGQDDINSFYLVVNNVDSYCSLTHTGSSQEIVDGTCSWVEDEVRIEVGGKAIKFSKQGVGLKGDVLLIEFCDKRFEDGMYLGESCKVYLSDVALGSGGCQFPSDCQSFGDDITSALQYANSVSKNCSVKFSGFRENKGFEGSISCLKYDFSGDGLADIRRLEYYPGRATEVIISGTGDGKKISCQFIVGDNGDEYDCDEYSATGCSGSFSETSCNFSCKGEWVSSGYSTSEGGCVTEDINFDGKDELIVFVGGEDGDGLSGVAISSDKSSVGLDCSFSSSSFDINCKVKVGSCNIDQCPSKGTDLKSIIAGCSMKDYAECSLTSEEENCWNIVLSLFSKEGDGESYCSKVDEKSGENVEIRKIKGGYEYTKGSSGKGFTYYTCPESSEVDFSQCSISGCEISEKTADIVASLSDFASEGTKQTYTMKISDTKAGIEGEIKVVYYVLDDIAEIEGKLKTKSGDIELSGKVKGDGSAYISLKMKLPDGRETKGEFSFKSDGSGTGTITADNRRYSVKFNADGSGEICDEANRCESLS